MMVEGAKSTGHPPHDAASSRIRCLFDNAGGKRQVGGQAKRKNGDHIGELEVW